jgi:hypothetical protein
MSDAIMDAYRKLIKDLEIANVKIRNDAIEECAVLCEDIWTSEFSDPGRDCAEAIRKLKEERK